MRGIEACCRKLEPEGALQVLDGIDGRRILTEECLPHLEGYRQAAPVRMGRARPMGSGRHAVARMRFSRPASWAGSPLIVASAWRRSAPAQLLWSGGVAPATRSIMTSLPTSGMNNGRPLCNIKAPRLWMPPPCSCR